MQNVFLASILQAWQVCGYILDAVCELLFHFYVLAVAVIIDPKLEKFTRLTNKTHKHLTI